jgi:hypothetical protein
MRCAHPGKEGFTVEWPWRSRLLARDERVLQGSEFHFLLFQKPKTCAQDVARGTVGPLST